MENLIEVFSAPKHGLFEEFLIESYASKAEDFKEQDARLNEIKRILSTLGVDIRDEINDILIAEILELSNNSEIKKVVSKKHDKKKNTRVFSVSGNVLEISITEIDTYCFTPRSGLNAVVIVKREKEKSQKKDSYDLLEYRDGKLLLIIAGGAGESIIDSIGELAKSINISIPAYLQLTYRERKNLERDAAETLQDIYKDSIKNKKKN
jgi:hypothetical protein